MNDFDQTPFISPDAEARAARVTQRQGRKILHELIDVERVSPTRTVSGRWMLSPADARKFWAALYGQA